MTLTAEQSNILYAATGYDQNLTISALAGCGKTSMLELIQCSIDTRPVLFLAFNKKIADEAKPRMLSTTTVRTFNSLGHRIWAKAVNKNLTLNPKKTQDILRSIIDEIPRGDQGLVWEYYWHIIQAVGVAKSIGYVPDGKFQNATRLVTQSTFHAALDETPDDLTSDLIDATLVRSITQSYSGIIDYNDQVYMPALFGGAFPQFPLVLVDEAQDLNPINHAILNKLVKHRIILVGDHFQSIYGFRGAVQNGMETLTTKYQTLPLDLTVSFRCPQAIVENARWRVPHFKWYKNGGNVQNLSDISVGDINDDSVILCRTNAPLFKMGINLLSRGRSVSVAGSDIGPKLIGIMKKLGPESTAQPSALSMINNWLAERVAKGSATATDLAECMRVFLSYGSNLGQAISYVQHLFAQRGTIRLMSGHKSKGLEFENVYILDPWLIREADQDLNLRYVMETRSMNNLSYIDSRKIKWD